MLFIVAHKLIKLPDRVRNSSFNISPKALGMKNRPSIAPLATTRQRTSAEMDKAINESKTIHTAKPAMIDQIIHAFAHSQPVPASEAWKKKISSPGTHVTQDSR